MADEDNLNRWERAALRPPELWNFEAMPLPPMARPRWLRRLPHVLIGYGALTLAILGSDELVYQFRLHGQYGIPLGVATAAVVGYAMRRPLAAWWMSLGIAALTAFAVAGQLPGGQPWPWTVPGVIANAAVLFLLALRVRTRIAVKALVVTVGVGFVFDAFGLGMPPYNSSAATAALVYAVVVLVGVSLHGRREARDRLAEQESLTAEERSRRTLLEERNRIARELHDVVAHHMSVISIQAQVAPHLVQNPSDELKENLEGIRENALEALTELRRVLGVLRSENPEGAPHAPQPTLDRLDSLVENVRNAGLSITTDSSGEPHPLSPGVELSAYRIIQEALSNAIRHAPGSEVRVEIVYKPSVLGVRVINTAPAKPAPPSPGAGHGLLGMRERAAMLGGGLAAGRTPDGGYEVTAHLPLQVSKDNA
ncbi:sensor histidine kinase [Streptomyces sp. NPDC019443]|uniref:sensor histidine kinase n=1 Tax=Streptomyces sp. NPDC019443 TaxID=3365061 RepID=UPI00379EF93F